MHKLVATTLLAAGALAAALGAADLKTLKGDIKIDGSSTVNPITVAVAEDFRAIAPTVRVTVGLSGTGGGFKRFAAGEIDISNASRPIKKDEADKARKNGVEFLELPIAFDGLSIVVNPANYWCETLTMNDLMMIFGSGRAAKTWREVNPQWPDRPIKIFSPGTDSGTFDYFKEEVVGKEGTIRSDMSVSEDDNVLVTGVAGDEGAIGFFGYAYYAENQDKVKLVKIDAGKGAILPTAQTIENGSYAPFSRPLFIYVNKASAARPEVKAFVEFFLKEGSPLVEEVGYVKLPQAITDLAAKNFAASRTGTQFMKDDGTKVTGPLAQVYH